ncbi:MAG: M23 family metallopeptidase, partial [Mycobacteriaceae bacterium]
QARAAAVGPSQAGSSAPALRRPYTPVVAVSAVRPSPSSSGTVAPAAGWLSSGFGPRGGTIHFGQDIANDTGTPIVSVQAGTVVSAGPASGFGLWVRVLHDDGTITVYGHNDYNVVSAGARVRVGEQIAVIGNRGESTGPHVHFEVSPGGYGKVDPLRWLRSRGVDL